MKKATPYRGVALRTQFRPAPPKKPDCLRASCDVLRSIEAQDLQRTRDMAGPPWRRWNEVFFAMFSEDLPIQPPPPIYPNAAAVELAYRLRREALAWSAA